MTCPRRRTPDADRCDPGSCYDDGVTTEIGPDVGSAGSLFQISKQLYLQFITGVILTRRRHNGQSISSGTVFQVDATEVVYPDSGVTALIIDASARYS